MKSLSSTKEIKNVYLAVEQILSSNGFDLMDLHTHTNSVLPTYGDYNLQICSQLKLSLTVFKIKSHAKEFNVEP